MRKFLKQLQKGLRAACATAALATCWNVGQSVAQAGHEWGDEVTVRISGTISPSITDLSHVFLIFCTGVSTWQSDYQAVNLGQFSAGRAEAFSVQVTAIYMEEFNWIIAGLYGDLSVGQYTEGTNGVALSANYDPAFWTTDGWYDFISPSESDVFEYLLSDNAQTVANNVTTYEYRYLTGYLECSETRSLYNFSNPVYNGIVQIASTVVPEPATILWLGCGGVVVFVRKKRNE